MPAPYISSLLTNVLPYLEFESSKPKSTVSVKSYVGMSVSDAKKALTGEEINYKVIGDGDTVITQLPSVGSVITKDISCVYLYTIKSEEELITVPSLIGMNILAAQDIAKTLGLNIRLEGDINSTGHHGYTVITQSIPPDTRVRRGEVIILRIVSIGFED